MGHVITYIEHVFPERLHYKEGIESHSDNWAAHLIDLITAPVA